MAAHPSSNWSILSTVVASAVAVVATSFAQSWFTKSILLEPISVKIIPEPQEGKPKRKRRVEEEPEPELLNPKNEGSKDDSDSVAPPPLRYGRFEQIWDPEEYRYVEYTAPPPRKVPNDDELLHWFKVYSRRKTTKRDEKPEISVEVHSRSLTNFLRTTFGGMSAFEDCPLIGVHELFPLQDTFSEWLQRLESSKVQTIDLEAKREMANSMGIPDAFDGDLDEPTLVKHFEILQVQLTEFVACLDKEFEPILEELATFLSHGHTTFELLGYMHKPGVKLLMHDKLTEDKIAVRMKSSNYHSNSRGDMFFTINGNGREWDGTNYSIVSHSRTVGDWKGTRSVASLPWGILRVDDEQELTNRGRIYCQYSGIYHVYNKGPLGGRGRAMVDHDSRPGYLQGHFQDTGRRKEWGEVQVIVSEPPETKIPETELPEIELPDTELCLLPPTVSGFMLRAKQWVKMHVLSLRPVKFDRNAWEHLVLDPDTKLLIRSLVDVTCNGSGKALVQDVITGKGGGLVSVLHGKPGTGKTLTAEAVAEHLERPIYIVGSEELPFNAGSLESSLRSILDLAARWDAVLLIDEADVFLEQRSMHELERNAVVSVALRLLEYHSGVLFLTTNRIQSFDEAFLSRFSIGIKYPDLDQPSRLKIWQSFLRLADVKMVDQQEDLADTAKDGKSRVFVKDLEDLAEKSFNGRSIKNLVRTSQALALANNEPLAITHLRIVVRTSERFLRDFEIEGPGA